HFGSPPGSVCPESQTGLPTALLGSSFSLRSLGREVTSDRNFANSSRATATESARGDSRNGAVDIAQANSHASKSGSLYRAGSPAISKAAKKSFHRPSMKLFVRPAHSLFA